MIQEFVKQWEARKSEIQAIFAENHPENYKAIVVAVVGILGEADEYSKPDPERIHEIDDGDYQGTLIYVIGATGYQPSDYWYVKVGYGSCSGCDTLESIKDYSSDKPSEAQVKDYMTLALHIIQGIKKMGEEVV